MIIRRRFLTGIAACAPSGGPLSAGCGDEDRPASSVASAARFTDGPSPHAQFAAGPRGMVCPRGVLEAASALRAA